MEKYVERMIEEHAQLVKRITKLHNFIYGSEDATKVNKADFANMCIQLKAMKVYAEALQARLENAGIGFTGGGYTEHIAEIDFNDDEEKEDNSSNN